MTLLYSLADQFLQGRYRNDDSGVPLLVWIFVILIIILIYKLVTAGNKLYPADHYQHQFPNCNYSAQTFYDEVKKRVEEKKYPDVKVKRVTHPEGGAFSSGREYLRVARSNLVFDVCAAPFGKDFFVSWWQASRPTGYQVWLIAFPILGRTALKYEREQRYYERDTEVMFKSSIQDCVMNVVKLMEQETSLRQIAQPQQSTPATVATNA